MATSRAYRDARVAWPLLFLVLLSSKITQTQGQCDTAAGWTQFDDVDLQEGRPAFCLCQPLLVSPQQTLIAQA